MVKQQLGQGDFVNLEELASGDLRLSSIQSKASMATIDCRTYDWVRDAMIGAYLSGADVITSRAKQDSAGTRLDVREFREYSWHGNRG